jgi:hypothetical protein
MASSLEGNGMVGDGDIDRFEILSPNITSPRCYVGKETRAEVDCPLKYFPPVVHSPELNEREQI